MAKDGAPRENTDPQLLAPDESAPFTILNPTSEAPVLLICDHASRRFPQTLGTLGLDPVARRCHLAWDIGAGALTECLADGLGVTAVLAQYSRLIVDCNRDLFDPGAFLEFGDGVVVHGNRNLSQVKKNQRAADIYWPYHNAIEAEIKRLSDLESVPEFFAIHSFTPVLNGVSRDVEIGILWDADRPTAEFLIDSFRSAGFKVGDNDPYSGKAPQDFTIDHHAETNKLRHAGIEIRQDLIDHESGVHEMATIMHEMMLTMLASDHRNKLVLGPTGS